MQGTTSGINRVFDERAYDVPHNQILKATFVQLFHDKDLAKSLNEEIGDMLCWLQLVKSIHLSSQIFRRVHIETTTRVDGHRGTYA